MISPLILVVALLLTSLAQPPEPGHIVEVTEMVEPEPIVEVVEVTPWWTDAEHDLLSRLVYAEAGNSSVEVMSYVAAVVVNRALYYPEQFGDSINAVIYRPGQYSCSGYLGSVEPSEDARQAALLALQEQTGAPTTLVWQSSKPQAAWGTSVDIWKVVDGTPHDIYFCNYGR